MDITWEWLLMQEKNIFYIYMMLIKRQRECASFTGSSMSTAGVLALSATAADLCTHS